MVAEETGKGRREGLFLVSLSTGSARAAFRAGASWVMGC